MNVAIPKLKIEETISEIVNLSDCVQINQLQIRRFRTEISKLLQDRSPNPALCYMGLGLVDAMENKRLESYKNFDNALRLDQTNPFIVNNYSYVCTKMGDPRKGMQLAIDICEKFPGNISLLEAAIMRCQHAAYFTTAIAFSGLYDAVMVNEAPTRTTLMVKQIKEINASVVAANLTDEDMLKRLETAIETIRMSDYDIRQSNTLFLRDGTFIHQIYIHADVDACAEMNFKIADSLVAHFENTGSEIASIMCRPFAYLENAVGTFA